MEHRSRNVALGFSCLGHLYMHFATAMFFTMALALESLWELPFHEVNALWFWGGLLVGAAALPAGLLGDRWSARGMMAIFLLGLGIFVFLCGFLDNPGWMLWGLIGIGLFAAIYHPIGIPWLIANAGERKGVVLAINGMFGGIGPALAGLVTGFLIDLAGWQAAFFLPGLIIFGTGVLMLGALMRGMLPATGLSSSSHAPNQRADAVRVGWVLFLTMFAAGIVYHTTQSVLPKMFEIRWTELVQGKASAAGTLVFLVYLAGAVMQLLGGYLADRFPLKTVYAVGWLIQIAFLTVLAQAGGAVFFIAAMLSASAGTGILPAENMLLFKYAPARHKGLVFGLKFILSFGAAPLALVLNSFMQREGLGYEWLFASLAVITLLAFLASIFLPGEGRKQTGPVPAAE